MTQKVENYLATYTGVIVKIDGENYKVNTTDIAEMFERFGWSFVKSLGVALYRADMHNTVKILTTFQDYVVEYIIWFWIKDHKNWVIWLPWYTEKRIQQELDGIMKNHQQYVCLLLRKDTTVENLMEHFISYKPTNNEK